MGDAGEMSRDIDVDFAAIDGILEPYTVGPAGLRLTEVLPEVRGVELQGTRAGLARLVLVLLEVMRRHEVGESEAARVSEAVAGLGWVVSRRDDLPLFSISVVESFEHQSVGEDGRGAKPVSFRDRLGLLGCGLVGFVLLFLLISGVLFWGLLLLGKTVS